MVCCVGGGDDDIIAVASHDDDGNVRRAESFVLLARVWEYIQHHRVGLNKTIK